MYFKKTVFVLLMKFTYVHHLQNADKYELKKMPAVIPASRDNIFSTVTYDQRLWSGCVPCIN